MTVRIATDTNILEAQESAADCAQDAKQSRTTDPRDHFTFLCVDGTPYLEECFRLRYEVYCHGRRFLDPTSYPDGRESDEFDEHSIHFGCVARRTNSVVGTIRLVARSALGFPLSSHCKFDESALPESTCEISRLAVSKEYRRRADDDAFGVPSAVFEDDALANRNRRRRPEIVLGLYKVMYQESKRRGVNAWIAAMESSLVRLLWRYSFTFDAIGPEVDYYGPVVPYLARIDEIEKTVRARQPQLYAEFNEGALE